MRTPEAAAQSPAANGAVLRTSNGCVCVGGCVLGTDLWQEGRGVGGGGLHG